jgi:anaerobic selenocysteine-containing dehydrogenase
MVSQLSHAQSQVVRTACSHDCPDACAMLVTVEHGRAVKVAANPAHPITGHHLCAKVNRYLERVYSPDRLLIPLQRQGPKGSSQFAPISWEVALETITHRWQAIIARHSAAAILPYSYMGSLGVLSGLGTMAALFHRLGASRLERTICGGQAQGLGQLVGRMRTDPEHLADARLILAWGIDPISTTVHTWSLIRRAMQRGARLVVIDPYRSRTAAKADLHVQLYPGTDGALVMGLLHVILRDGLEDTAYLAQYTTGLAEFRSQVEDWTPARAAQETGVPPAQIVALAHEYATTHPACIRHGIGLQRATGAGMALRLIQCLPVVTGQWRDAAGGIAGPQSAGMLYGDHLSRPDFGPPAPRTLNMIQLGRHLTDPALRPPIAALYVFNANPAVIAPEQERVLQGLRREDLFTVVHEQFLTDTARYADIILPATTMLEQEDLLGSWGFNYVALSQRAIAPQGEAKSNTEVARLLAARLGFTDELFRLSDSALIDLAVRDSPAEHAGVTRDYLETHGFARVGPPPGHAPFAEGHFPTPSGTFEFASPGLAKAGYGPFPTYIPPAESPQTRADLAQRFPLRLLTLKRHWSINSSYGNLPVLLRAEPEPSVELHPDDAAVRGIGDGQMVRVWNERGAVTYRARVSDRLMPGTVAVPFGPWIHNGASVNTLTSARLSDIGHGPTFCDTLVEVTRECSDGTP